MTPILEKWQNLSSRTRDLLLTLLAALLAFLPRIFGLSVFLTADEPKSWFGRSIQFLDALATGNFANTFDSPAPGVTTMWAGAIGLLLDYARQGFPGPLRLRSGQALTEYLAAVPFDPLYPTILPLIRLGGVAVAVIAVALTYWWGKDVFGRPAAFIAATLLALDPFTLALSRILGHDAMVSLFMWLSLLAFLKAAQSPKHTVKTPFFTIHYSLFTVVSGVFGGLAFLSKYPSLSLGAFIAVTMLILYLRSDRSFGEALKDWFVDMLLWSLAAGAIFTLLFPAMWVQPLQTAQAILSDAFRASGSPHQKGSFFLGSPAPDPGAIFYLLVTMFKTTPVLWLGWSLLAIGPVFNDTPELNEGERGRRREGEKGEFPPSPHPPISPSFTYWQLIIIFAAFAIFYGILVSVGGKKQDRYILPIFPALIGIASLGYLQLVNFVARNFRPSSHRKKGGRGVATAGVIAAVIAMQVFFTLPHHPYYFSYYNSLMGGGKMASKLMIVGWGEGMDKAARWLNTQPDAQNLDVVAWYSTTFEPFFDGHAIYKIGEEKISRTPKPGLAADYVVLYVNQIQRQLPSAGALQHLQAVSPVYTVTINDIDYAWIYPSIKMQRVILNETRLVGQAELLGYNICETGGQGDKETGSNRPPAHLLTCSPAFLIAGETNIIELYWEWRGKSPDEPIRLSLVDETGEVWGEGKALGTQARLPFDEWQEGMVAHDDFALTVFPGAPPGDYYLKVWIDRPATGEIVGVFPLTNDDARVQVARPETFPAAASIPLDHRADAPLNNEIQLLGYNNIPGALKPGDTLPLILYWQATQSPASDYRLQFTLMGDETGQFAQWETQPNRGRYPTAQWQNDEIVRDAQQLTMPRWLPGGNYDLTVNLLDKQEPSGKTIHLSSLRIDGRAHNFALETPPATLQSAQFGDAIELLGFDLSDKPLTPGDALDLSLVWKAILPPVENYVVFAQLLDSNNQVVAQHDSQPGNNTLITSAWAQNEYVTDPHALLLPDALSAGNYQLIVGMYRPETGERLPAFDANRQSGRDYIALNVTLTVNSE